MPSSTIPANQPSATSDINDPAPATFDPAAEPFATRRLAERPLLISALFEEVVVVISSVMYSKETCWSGERCCGVVSGEGALASVAAIDCDRDDDCGRKEEELETMADSPKFTAQA